MQDTTHRPANLRAARWMLLGYVGLLLYGSWFPLTGWRPPEEGLLELFHYSTTQRLSRTDVILNILIYVPFGLLWVFSLRRAGRRSGLLGALLAGLALSLLIEWVQSWLPLRTPSARDLFTNGLGAAIGALFGLMIHKTHTAEHGWAAYLRALRDSWVRPGPLGDVGLVVLGLWVLSQTTPLVPSLDWGQLKEGFRPITAVLRDGASLQWLRLGSYALSLAALWLLASTLVRPGKQWGGVLLLLIGGVLLAKVPIAHRQLSLEMILGGLLGITIVARLGWLTTTDRCRLAVGLILSALLLEALRPGGSDILHSFNWMPLKSHVRNLVNLIDLVENTWPFVMLAYLVFQRDTDRPAPVALRVGWMGGAGLFIYVFVLEWVQQWVPGRYPDITNGVVAVVAWGFAWAHLMNRPAQATNN